MRKLEILNRQDEIVRCAKSFRRDANQIMSQLAKHYKFNLNVGDSIRKEVYQHKRNNPGLFYEVWQYYFHGAEVRFENIQTGQILELIYITQPEFGFLDGYFFHQYMKTTCEFKELGEFYNDSIEVWDAIDRLADIGALCRAHVAFNKRNVRAH